jgi:hypothetical protein
LMRLDFGWIVCWTLVFGCLAPLYFSFTQGLGRCHFVLEEHLMAKLIW